MKRRMAALGIVAGVLAVLLAVTEAGWRVFPLYAPIPKDPDPRYGGTYFPGAFYRYTKEGYSSGFVNAHGLRGTDYAYARTPGTRRVEFLGDSFVEGLQVDAAATCTSRLEQDLDALPGATDWQVLNMARSGDNTVQSYLFWRDEGRRYRPDIVLLWINADYSFLNSVRDTALEPDARAFVARSGDGFTIDAAFAADFRSAAFRLVHVSPLRYLKRSAFYNFLYWRLHLLKSTWAPGGSAAAPPAGAGKRKTRPSLLEWPLGPREEAVWSLMLDFVGKFRDEASSEGSRLVVVFNPPWNPPPDETPGRSYDPVRTERRLFDELESAGIPVIDLGPAFRRPGSDACFLVSPSGRRGHWTAEGHRVAAEAITRGLAALGLAERGSGRPGAAP